MTGVKNRCEVYHSYEDMFCQCCCMALRKSPARCTIVHEAFLSYLLSQLVIMHEKLFSKKNNKVDMETNTAREMTQSCF